MHIRVKDNNINDGYILQLGDIVVFNYTYQIKMVIYSDTEQEYALRDITTMNVVTYFYKTLEDLTESIKDINCKIYKRI